MSWCARMRRDGVIRVLHGDDVETRADRFVEGAWDGDFDAFDFLRALTLAGSGGVCATEAACSRPLFIPWSGCSCCRAPRRRSFPTPSCLRWIEAGDGPDLAYPSYFFELVSLVRAAWVPAGRRLRTASGKQVETLRSLPRDASTPTYGNAGSPMPLGPPPSNYAEYFELLAGTTQRRGRQRRRRRAAGSPTRPWRRARQGYDSDGFRGAGEPGGLRGRNYLRSSSGTPSGHPGLGMTKPPGNDSGAKSLRALGMNVTERDRLDILKMPGHPKAELFFRPQASTDASMLVMEDKLARRRLLSGRHGERYWGPTTRCSRTHFREVDDVNLSGNAYGEFRARDWIRSLPVSLHRRPARTGDLPHHAFRRDASVEAGNGLLRPTDRAAYCRRSRRASRELRPRPSSAPAKRPAAWDRRARPIFRSSCARSPGDSCAVREKLAQPPTERAASHHYRLGYLRTNYSHLPLVSSAMDLLGTERMHRLWGSVYLYVFHWGFQKMRSR